MPNIDERLTDLRVSLSARESNPDFADVIERSAGRQRARRTRTWTVAGVAAFATVLGATTVQVPHHHDDGGPAASHDVTNPSTTEWGEVQVPGRACFSSHPIQLHHGQANIPAGTLPRDVWNGPYRSPRTLTLLDVTQGKGSEGRTAITLMCADGGTAAGDLLSSVAVYGGGGDSARLLGLILPMHQPPDGPGTLLEVRHVGHDDVSVIEHVFRRTDPDCCPSGRIRTLWTYRDGRYRPGVRYWAPPVDPTRRG